MFGVDSVLCGGPEPHRFSWGGQRRCIPQYAAGGVVRKTTLALINLEPTQTSVSLRLLDDSGAPIGSELSITLPAKGRAVLSDPGVFGLSASGPIVQGYLRIISDRVEWMDMCVSEIPMAFDSRRPCLLWPSGAPMSSTHRWPGMTPTSRVWLSSTLSRT